MKKTLFISAFAIALTSLTAGATEQAHPEQEKLHRFDFSCQFGEHLKDPKPANEIRCEASARVFAFVRDYKGAEHVLWNRSNLLSVSCGGELLVASSASVDSGRKAVSIISTENLPAAVIIPRKDTDAIGAEWMNYRSYLKIDHENLIGECRVRSVPVDHDMDRDTNKDIDTDSEDTSDDDTQTDSLN